MAEMFFRFSKGNVYDLLLGIVRKLETFRTENWTHFTRSNADTLFPTGLSTELPSEVKMMLPC